MGQHWTILQLFVLFLGFISGLDLHLMRALMIFCLVSLNVGEKTKGKDSNACQQIRNV